MRIVHVTDGYLPRLGGIEMHVHDLATRQRLLGHDTIVITKSAAAGPATRRAATDRPAPTRTATHADADTVPTVRLAGGNLSTPAARALAGADVVHCHCSVVSPLAWSAIRRARVLGVPVVATMHSVLPTSPLLASAMAGAARALGPDALWTAVSAVAADALAAVVRRDVEVLPNGVDVAAWTPRARPAGQLLTLVSVMRLSPRKRALPLVDILAGIRRRMDPAVPIRAVVVGDGPQSQVLQRRLRQRGMADWVQLTGRLDREQIAAHLGSAHVFLAPATLESFGIAALEARSAGVPVVAMRAGGVGDFVRDGVEGLLVDSDQEMAEATSGLLSAPEVLQRIRHHNATTTAGLDWASVLDRCAAVYARAGAPADLPVRGNPVRRDAPADLPVRRDAPAMAT
jgi:glycosyltransferase involved in cell wall biosynthesis